MNFDIVRPIFGDHLSQSQVDGINTILSVTDGQPTEFRAYMLATPWWETDRTMQPIAEYGHGRGRPYGVPGKHNGQIAYGRGYVQLTWDSNYEKADAKLGLGGKLLANYDLALEPDIAAQIMLHGMLEGWFTGAKLADYLPGNYVGARRIINGLDHAVDIAGAARTFEYALRS